MKSLVIRFILMLIVINGHAQKIFLVGDVGASEVIRNELLKQLAAEFPLADEKDVLLFLGGTIHPKGLPGINDPDRLVNESKLMPQLELLNSFPGKTIVLPGDEEWARGKKEGWDNAKNIEAFIRSNSDKVQFLPENSCPGPVQIKISSSTTLIIFNSQYFLHPWNKPGEGESCPSKSTIEALEELKEIIALNQGKHIILAGHHPMFSYGKRHGNYPLKQHLFPLTSLNEKLYIPLPIIGSIPPFFRRILGTSQDINHPRYRLVMKQILAGMKQCKEVVFASAHEHSLQLIQREGHHFIVSGSGSKKTHVGKGKSSKFAKSEFGYAILNVTDEGQANVIFKDRKGAELQTQSLYVKELKKAPEIEVRKSFKDSTSYMAASNQYTASVRRKRWLGTNYRDVWKTKLPFQLIDLASEKGGLEVLKRGGGMQTKSLRLKAANGKQYVLRSIEKYPENAIPIVLRNTFAQDVVQDQISSSHPYAAYIIPHLAEAAGIYHTNPKPVIIPDDPLLREHRQTFAGLLALYEERPNKEAAGDPHFGGGKDVEGTFKVLEELQEDNDNLIDQHFVVRNRLFDLWIGDWDRHDDQWRWAEFKNEYGGNTYRPIPRDRDQAFFINEGIIPYLAARKWALPKIEGFDEEVDWAPGLADNARFFDRTFMNEPDWNDWNQQIKELQTQLSDEVIDQAIDKWPKEIQSLTGERVRNGLVARRADMQRYGKELYLFLSKEVEVVGSDKHELFLIHRPNKSEVKITAFKRKKDGKLEQKIYERVFKADETKEIRIFGRDGEDVFQFLGMPKGKIRVRIIGGTDKDRIVNDTESALKKVKVYDRKKSTVFEGSNRGIARLSTDPKVNEYNRKSFKYDKLFPLIDGGYNPDDGVFLGGGFIYRENKWRKNPYAHKQTLDVTTAAATGAFNIEYEGDYKQVFGEIGLNTSLNWFNPAVVNFFGVGNDSEFVNAGDRGAIAFYRTRVRSTDLDFSITNPIGSKAQIYLGSGYRTVRVEETSDRFVTTDFRDLPAFDPDIFKRHRYVNTAAGITFDTRDNLKNPTLGMNGEAEFRRLEGTNDISESFSQISGEWSFFISTRIPARLTLANRLGGAKNLNSGSPFFNLNALGGWTNLRGYRRTRFLGDASFYHNLDLRLKLLTFRSYLFPASLGLLAFHDVGRVWISGENSDSWHTGKGFGIWLSPLNAVIVNFTYAFGEEENIPSIRFGFLF